MHYPWSFAQPNKSLTPFQCFCVYLSLRSHFTRDGYDIFKYRGGISATQTSFECRKDKYYFMRLSRHPDPVGLLLSNMLEKPTGWVGDLFNEEVYADWKKRQEALTYSFKTDLGKLEEDFHSNLVVPDGGVPYLLSLLTRKLVSLETVCLLQSIVNFAPYWGKNIANPVWSAQYAKLVTKYAPFLEFDPPKIRQVLEDKFPDFA